MKLCKDCKHSHDDSFNMQFLKCGYRDPVKVDPVTGKGNPQPYTHCSILRNESFILSFLTGGCGSRGRFFEPKP